MAIVNRDLDISEQTRVLSAVVSTSVGASAASNFFVAQLPYPATLKGVAVAANSVSGTPQVSVSIQRFTAAGATVIAYAGSTLAVVAHGTSVAYQTVTMATAGSTLLNLQAGDVVILKQEFSGGNVAISNAVVTVSVTALQDVKKFFDIVQ